MSTCNEIAYIDITQKHTKANSANALESTFDLHNYILPRLHNIQNKDASVSMPPIKCSGCKKFIDGKWNKFCKDQRCTDAVRIAKNEIYIAISNFRLWLDKMLELEKVDPMSAELLVANTTILAHCSKHMAFFGQTLTATRGGVLQDEQERLKLIIAYCAKSFSACTFMYTLISAYNASPADYTLPFNHPLWTASDHNHGFTDWKIATSQEDFKSGSRVVAARNYFTKYMNTVNSQLPHIATL